MSPASGLDTLIGQLRDDLAFRRLESGMRLLADRRPLILTLAPGTASSGVLLGVVAQWVDAGFDSPDVLRTLLPRFAGECRGSLPLTDYVHLRMAEGMLDMRRRISMRRCATSGSSIRWNWSWRRKPNCRPSPTSGRRDVCEAWVVTMTL
ncbi:MAG TPA: hypothetical protein VG456_17905 [Candidatus Sulfopaludibacter sp.]|jgi:hypothetical protein|nr:hypothetical protein [Candidatus Sulfopaludibacter sp.]